MAGAGEQPSIPARRLAERLRALREYEYVQLTQGKYVQLTQGKLARALGGSDQLSIASVSLWEKPGSDRLPPPGRLAAYARLFCTDRSFSAESPRLLRDDELTEQERRREAELYEELLALRDRAQLTGPASSIWHFPDGSPISIVCSKALEPPSYAYESHLNYSQYAKYADLDALLEVFGQVRAENPACTVGILTTEALQNNYALNHIIIIGGAAFREPGVLEWFAEGIPLPPTREAGKTYTFDCTVGAETREFASALDNGTMVNDVGLIARVPHPNISGRTVTVLSGITSRGVHGAALCFTDLRVKKANEEYLQADFGNASAFCILMRVTVRNDQALPPDLSDARFRLYEWSAETGSRWGTR